MKHNSGILLLLNTDKIFELHNSKFYFHRKFEKLRKINEKLAMESQFDLTRFYDVILRNSVL